MAQYIYTMHKVRKAHGDKVILDDVTLAFLPGAKIGVVGPNGAGKSTVLKIMAGLDQASNGDALLAPGRYRRPAAAGAAAGRGPRPSARTSRTRSPRLRGWLARFEEVSAAMGDPDADFDALLAEQGDLMEKIEHAEGWELDSRIEQAMDALRCPPGDEPVTHLSGGERRRVALCKLLLEQPDLLLLDEPTNHLDAESVQWLEQHLAKYPGTVLAVTHDRYFLDNVAQWILELDRGRAYPYEGNYSTYLEKKAERLKVEGKKDQKLQKRLARRARVGAVRTPRAARPRARRGWQRYEEMAAEAEKTRKLDFEEIQIPPGPRLGNVVVEVEPPGQGLRRPRADRGPVVLAAARRHRRRHRPERRRQDHAVQDDRRAGEAGLRRGPGRRDRQDQLRRPEPRRHRPEEERLGGRLRRPGLHQGRPGRDARRGPTSPPSASRARTSRSRPACCPAASATG